MRGWLELQSPYGICPCLHAIFYPLHLLANLILLLPYTRFYISTHDCFPLRVVTPLHVTRHILRLLTLLYCYSTLASSLSTHVIWFCWALLFLNHFSYSYICHSDFSHIGILGLYEIILCNPAVWCLLSHAVSYVVFRIWFHFDVWIFLILFLTQYFAVCFSIVFASVCFVLQNPYCAVAAQ